MQCAFFFSLYRNEKIYEMSTFHEQLGIAKYIIFKSRAKYFGCSHLFTELSFPPFTYENIGWDLL